MPLSVLTALHRLRYSSKAVCRRLSCWPAPSSTRRNARSQSLSTAKPLCPREVTFKPVKKLTVYITPHSHTDIGYTEIQTAIEAKQVQNLIDGIAAAQKTASYPEGARFVWNVEVLWAADLYLHRLDDRQKEAFLEAVRKGQVTLNGMYLNELTGLCRPEELVRLFRYATELAEQTGGPIDAAMISDVPGYTWGTVTRHDPSGHPLFLGGAELLRSHRYHPPRMGEQAVLLGGA